ncbi:heat shock 22 kDa protein, mitochondrial [Artemisia annua]|uniref:Heat shock 22 kDa protein, mitochondrial n=1 Tax=Artemisia annua TaxID=35608 RepID=A0A2U1MTQ7_ARTAN|nr:heat shock 22 kDa protein, mitochondrial [Artemisia annua]
MPGAPEEDIKVSVQHDTVVIEGPGDEIFLALHPFEKYLCWVDLEYGIYNMSGIKAEMKRNLGVLKLTVPKLKQEEVRAFDLKVNFVDKLD